MKEKYYTYSGLIHVHSTYSDGTRTIEDIAGIANELDVQVLLMSDHNTLKPKFDGLEGWYDKVLVGIGCEINDAQDENHLLAFNLKDEIDFSRPAEEYVCSVRDQGGIGIIAHPNESRDHLPQYPPYPWKLWDSDCFNGIEIWNQMSEWLEGLTAKNKYMRAMHPRRSIISPKKETLAVWDKLNLKRRVTGIGGVDAHGYVHKLWGFIPKRIFRYKISFRTIRTYIVTKQELSGSDHEKDLQLVYNALHSSNCFVAHRYYGDAADFCFSAYNKHGSAVMGDSLAYDSDTELHVINPAEAESTIIYNGEILEIKKGSKLVFNAPEAGIYRVESRYKGKLWILSNHIRLK